MTDGPFKNTNLTPRWKEYGDLLDHETFSVSDRVQQARKALIEDLLPADFKAAVRDVHKQLERLQTQLFPQIEAESIIDKHNACEQSETFRKHFISNLRSKDDVDTAFNSALKSTIESGIAQADQRLVVHCIEVDEKRNRADTPSALRANHTETFAGLDAGFSRTQFSARVLQSRQAKFLDIWTDHRYE